MRLNLDIDVLRTFVTGVEAGNFAQASERLGRSTSAVSAQLKKLEDQVGRPVLRRQGRGLVLTPAGEVVMAYARRLLELNDEAVLAIRGTDVEGRVRIGVQEDFGEHLLTRVLGAFARAHPRVQVEARITRNTELLSLVNAGQIDLAVAWNTGGHTAYAESLGEVPTVWIGAAGSVDMDADILPLAVFEPPCVLRSRAIDALDQAGMAWRIAFTSTSLQGLWSATGAGLGVTVRTPVNLPGTLAVITEGLPPLAPLDLMLYRTESRPSAAVARLADIVRENIAGILAMA